MVFIQILGTGTPKCKRLAVNAKTAVKKLNLDAQIESVTDATAIMGFGVKTTPALVIDGRIKYAGKTASVQDLMNLLRP